jgi:hypothetical protein
MYDQVNPPLSEYEIYVYMTGDIIDEETYWAEKTQRDMESAEDELAF